MKKITVYLLSIIVFFFIVQIKTEAVVLTATPVPVRPALCKSATVSKTTLGPGESLTITSTANTNQIKRFSYAFYNLDNLYPTPPANNPKGIFFVANTHYVRADNTTPPVTTHSITVTYNELNKPDLNWNSKKPIKIQVNAYFTNSQGGFSLPDAKCVVKFNMTLTSPTPTPIKKLTSTPTPVPCPKKAQGDANCDGKINGVDYSFWLNRQCTSGCATANLVADFNGDSKVNNSDYTIWFNNRQ